MKTGFVILNYNSWELTKKLAEKLDGFSCVDHIVVVDNVSTDESLEQLKKIDKKKICIVESPKNGGYSFGNNLGADKCKDFDVDIMFVSNPDVDVEEKDIELLLKQFEESDYSVLSAVEYDNDNMMTQPPIWKNNSYMDDLKECFVLGRKLFGNVEGEALDCSSEIQKVEIVRGSFFGIRMKDFIEIGGFDDHVFLFCEERILAKKIANQGKKMGIVTKAKYQHNHSASINKSYSKVYSQMKILYDSRRYYYDAYEQIGNLKKALLKISMKISLIEYFLLGILK